MKKFLIAGALALIVAGFSQQPASAWINCHFGIGFNWNWQSGGNNLLWGVFRNGQPGAPDWECHRHCGYNYAGHDYPMMATGYPMLGYQAPAAAPATWYQPAYQTVNFAPQYDDGFSYMLR
jgi:hypothetical protein